jgi:hypothetical protein
MDPVSDASATNRASRKAVPACVAIRYRRPASRTAALSSSKVTRKNELKAIASQATRNSTPLRAITTSAMLATRRLKKSHAGPGERCASCRR